jgi:putative oxidoreductase
MSTISSKIPTVARLGLGLPFAVMGLNKLFSFLPQPPMSGPPAEFFGALFATGYMLPLLAATEIVAGLLLLSGRFVPLALTLLAPVVVNILGFHLFLAKGGLPLPLTLVAAEVYLAWAYRDAFAPMLRARTAPRAHDAADRDAATARTSAAAH